MEEHSLAPVVGRYRDEGYDVVVRPQGDALPPFLAGFRPDLIAVRGDESAVVEIKANRNELAGDARLTELAELVEDHPGWRLDVVVLEPVTAFEKAAKDAAEPTEEQRLQTLRTAEELVDRGDVSIACVVAWGALEASMRRLSREAELHGPTSPIELAQTLYGNGFLTREQFRRLRESYKVRSQLVHGLVPSSVDSDLVRFTIATARSLTTGEGAVVHSAS